MNEYQPMASVFKNKSNYELERAWFMAFGSGPKNVDVWEAIVGRVQIDQWSPGTKFSLTDETNSVQSTLAEIWMGNHDSSWAGFMERVSLAFPVLDITTVVNSAIRGMRKNYVSSGRFEVAGDEGVVMNWLKAYEPIWSADALSRDRLLCFAIDISFLDVADLAIKCGANPQSAMPLVKNKKSFELLRGAGADPFLKLGKESLELFFGPESGKWPQVNKLVEAGATVYEYFVASDVSAFDSTKERETVLNLLARERLKASKSGFLLPEEERKKILEGVIKNARKKQDILVPLKACLPAAWDWQLNGKSVLMLLSDTRYFYDVYYELREKMTDASFLKRDSCGNSFFEYVVKTHRGVLSYSSDILDRMKALTPIDESAAWNCVKEMADGKSINWDHCLSCPAYGENNKFFMSGFDTKKFWELAIEDAETKGETSVIQVYLKDILSRDGLPSVMNSWGYAIRDWFEEDGVDVRPARLMYGKMGCILSLRSLVNGFHDLEMVNKQTVVDEIDFWAKRGVDVVSAIGFLKFNSGAFAILQSWKDLAKISVERYALIKSCSINGAKETRIDSVL